MSASLAEIRSIHEWVCYTKGSILKGIVCGSSNVKSILDFHFLYKFLFSTSNARYHFMVQVKIQDWHPSDQGKVEGQVW